MEKNLDASRSLYYYMKTMAFANFSMERERERKRQEEIKPLLLLLKVAIPLAFPLAGFILSTLTTNSRTKRTTQSTCPPQDQMDPTTSISQHEHGEDERSHGPNSSFMCREKGEQEPEKREPLITLHNPRSLEIMTVQSSLCQEKGEQEHEKREPLITLHNPRSLEIMTVQSSLCQEKGEQEPEKREPLIILHNPRSLEIMTVQSSMCQEKGEQEPEKREPLISLHNPRSLEIMTVQCSNNMREISIKQSEDGPNLEEDIETLKSQIAALQEKEHEFDSQISHYCNLKEQESAIQKLQIMCLGFKLESLEAQNQRLEDTIVELREAMKQYDMKKDVLNLLQQKVKKLQKTNRLHSRLIHQQALNLDAREVELSVAKQESTQIIKEIKDLVDQLHQDNKAMEEKPDQKTMMNPSASKNEKELMMEDDDTPRLSKKELFDQIERVREQWYADMEEMIYLGWIGACLRHEILMNQKEEDEKPVGGHLVVELPIDYRAHNCITEFNDSDGSSSVADLGDATMDVALMKHHSGSTKPRFLHMIKGWAKGKGRSKRWCDRPRSSSERWLGSGGKL